MLNPIYWYLVDLTYIQTVVLAVFGAVAAFCFLLLVCSIISWFYTAAAFFASALDRLTSLWPIYRWIFSLYTLPSSLLTSAIVLPFIATLSSILAGIGIN